VALEVFSISSLYSNWQDRELVKDKLQPLVI